MTQNLSDDERKDIEDLVSSLKPDSNDEEPAATEIPLKGSNGNSESDDIETEADRAVCFGACPQSARLRRRSRHDRVGRGR